MFEFDSIVRVLFNAACFYAGHKTGETKAVRELTLQTQQNEINLLKQEIERLKKQ